MNFVMRVNATRVNWDTLAAPSRHVRATYLLHTMYIMLSNVALRRKADHAK